MARPVVPSNQLPGVAQAASFPAVAALVWALDCGLKPIAAATNAAPKNAGRSRPRLSAAGEPLEHLLKQEYVAYLIGCVLRRCCTVQPRVDYVTNLGPSLCGSSRSGNTFWRQGSGVLFDGQRVDGRSDGARDGNGRC